jgi:hypothetical protein
LTSDISGSSYGNERIPPSAYSNGYGDAVVASAGSAKLSSNGGTQASSDGKNLESGSYQSSIGAIKTGTGEGSLDVGSRAGASVDDMTKNGSLGAGSGFGKLKIGAGSTGSAGSYSESTSTSAGGKEASNNLNVSSYGTLKAGTGGGSMDVRVSTNTKATQPLQYGVSDASGGSDVISDMRQGGKMSVNVSGSSGSSSSL